ncbi:Tumor susceptibility protein 101 protein [Elsinoe australis]|uniref:Tumor susceptibility protein 101 protein n=1 Tax=Elsinoe australis TaxID=40998 RepID=A0A2P8A679_9PEZI|nr:Tumor susceptibility protein 101 protein [Elsinoe australis]
MNFAPYQSSPPESTRALSPPPRSPTASPNQRTRPTRTSTDIPRNKPIASIADTSDPWSAARSGRLPSPSTFSPSYQDAGDGAGDGAYEDLEGQRGEGSYFTGRGGDGGMGDVFETSLGFRMDVEAALAYVLLPPAGGVVLLIFEHKSDYVRFHAWQSALVFSAAFVIHLVFSWTTVLSWLLFVGDLALIAYLAYHAYRDAETLDRCELPFFGRLASRFVDSE